MANPEHVARLKAGVKEWNQWRRINREINIDLGDVNLPGANLIGANLKGANLSGADLSGSHFSRLRHRTGDFSWSIRRAILTGANLSGANLSHANLGYVDLPRANLSRTDLSEADLREADFSGADLSRSNLSGALLPGTILTGADLSGANMPRALFGHTIFANTDLRGVKGLESCIYGGPSTVGLDTFFRSSGEIPEQFLRGCGLPEQFVTYAKSLAGKPVEFYSCFISYSTKDQDFADRLHADLQNNAVRCWFAPHHIQGGRKIHEQIDDAIRVYDRLLLILSEDSMNSSWVETEISKAREREVREKRQMLFPVRLVSFEAVRDWKCFDADTGKDSAREIREYFIPDFSNWKNHDSYKKAFDRLLRDLKAKPDVPVAI